MSDSEGEEEKKTAPYDPFSGKGGLPPSSNLTTQPKFATTVITGGGKKGRKRKGGQQVGEVIPFSGGRKF